MNKIWYGIGFSIVPFFVLVLGYLNIHPELYRSLPANFSDPASYPSTNIAWTDEDEKKDPPIQFVSSNHRALNLWTDTKMIQSFWDLWNPPASELEYEWEYVVKNISDEKRSITVYYKLIDENDNEVSVNSKTDTVEPGETLTLKNTHQVDYHKVSRIVEGSWSISNRISN